MVFEDAACWVSVANSVLLLLKKAAVSKPFVHFSLTGPAKLLCLYPIVLRQTLKVHIYILFHL